MGTGNPCHLASGTFRPLTMVKLHSVRNHHFLRSHNNPLRLLSIPHSSFLIPNSLQQFTRRLVLRALRHELAVDRKVKELLAQTLGNWYHALKPRLTIHLPPLSPPSRTRSPMSFIARIARPTLFSDRPSICERRIASVLGSSTSAR